MKAFPEAKVVLTVREPEAWFNSVKNTIYQLNADALSFPGNILSKFIGFDKKTAMIQKLSRRNQNRFNQETSLVFTIESILIKASDTVE